MKITRLLIALMMTVMFSSAAMAGSVTINHGGAPLTGTIDAGGIVVDQNGNAAIYVVEDLIGGGGCIPSSAVVNPTTISRTITEGDTASSQTVTIRDDCNNTLSYTSTVTTGGTWISAPSSGTGTMNVTFNTSGLSPSTYAGTIDVTPLGYPPQTITVNLTVSSQTPSEISYQDIVLTWDGNKYSGRYDNERIGPNLAQKFYRFTRPAECTSQIQIWLAGNIQAQALVNMLVSDYDFGTAEDALSRYQQFLSTTGYERYRYTTIGGVTYWYWFRTSYESEWIYILSPSASEYYIELINEHSTDTGIYRIAAYCW